MPEFDDLNDQAASQLAPPSLMRQPSLVDDAIAAHLDEAKQHISGLKQITSEDTIRGLTDLPDMKGVVFVGHTATDMDSIGSAIGAAELFDGIAARASEVNTETEWVLQHWGVEKPPPYLDVKENRSVCLVDHNQINQMTEGIELDSIVGCIDHHALQSKTIVGKKPIYVNIQPWGSACSILASMFVRNRRPIRRTTAGMLLCGILSDTLNLRSPTTTKHDRLMLTILAQLAEVTDVNKLAQTMFKEKSKSLLLLSPHGLLRGDLKKFKILQYMIAFGTIETVLPDDVLAKTEDLLLEMRALKREEKVDCVFLTVVDIMNQTSTLLICGQVDKFIAEKAFGGVTDAKTNRLDLGARVSRKKQFIPPLTEVFSQNLVIPEELIAADKKQIDAEEFGEVVMDCTEHGCVVKRRIPGVAVYATVARAVNKFHACLHKTQDPVLAHAHSHGVEHEVVSAFKHLDHDHATPLLALSNLLAAAHAKQTDSKTA